MEGVPLDMSIDAIRQAIASISGVRSVHDLHVWTLSSNRAALSAHVVVEDLHRWNQILREVATMLVERFGMEHATLQPERTVQVLRRIPDPK
jgi:cobalt-zinc-cadmium efflux system protein